MIESCTTSRGEYPKPVTQSPHTSILADRRLLIVHAHPDDESIGTGATMAKYAADGAHVTLVTCTLGEEGEVLIPELAQLAADQQDALGQHRITELTDAMSILGVTDFRFLGGPGKYRDSGMMGVPSNERADCFWRADLLDAAADLCAVIREVKPQVVVTYDDFGGYGHPDHIQAHRVTHYAVALAESASFRPELGPAWSVSKIYWTAFPKSRMIEGIEKLKAAGDTSEFASMDPENLPFVCDDSLISAVIDGSQYTEAKYQALAAHKTQVTTDSGFFALSNNLGFEIFSEEHFRLARGVSGSDTIEDDLFAGIV
jgi:N-acetyl-1-D-myo-inositol-2-amino-2-deoxy-alpha-D-glucopyranoside deacetylase